MAALHMCPLIKSWSGEKLTEIHWSVEEQKAGNTEFDTALVQTLESLRATELPELQWFMDNCLEAFSLNIDQL